MRSFAKLSVLSTLVGITPTFVPSLVNASSQEVKALKAQVEMLLKRIDKLEKKSAENAAIAEKAMVASRNLSQQSSQQLAGNHLSGHASARQSGTASASLSGSGGNGGNGTTLPIQDESDRAKHVAKHVERRKNPLSLKISGHINRGVMYTNNGQNSTTTHVDSAASPSRINVTGSGKVNAETEVGATFELGFPQNSSGGASFGNVPNNNNRLDVRKSEIFVKHEKYGELFVGRGLMASDGTMEDTDLSATTVVAAGATFSDIGGGNTFINKATGTAVMPNGDNASVGQIFDSGDGLGRQNRIRYNTPAFHGLSLQTSHYTEGSNNNWDVVAKFGATFRDVKIKTHVAFLQSNSDTRTANNLASGSIDAKYRQFNASAGVLFPNGISLFAATLLRDWQPTDRATGTVFSVRSGRGYIGKIGYQFNTFEWGKTALAVDYGRFQGMFFDVSNPQNTYDGTGFGIFAVQFIDKIATELYAGYRHFKMDTNIQNQDYKDVSAFIFGARLKF